MTAIVSRGDYEDGIPSITQEHAFVVDRLEPGPQNGIASAVWVSGALDERLLREALVEVTRRHDTLRGAFVVDEGVLRHRVYQRPAHELFFADLEELAIDEREGAALAVAVREASRAFELGEGPAWRATLLRTRSDRHLFAIAGHRLVLDRRAMGLLLTEVFDTYALLERGAAPAAVAALSHGDHAVAERTRLAAGGSSEHAAYWRQTLEAVAPLALPMDRTGGAHGSDAIERSIAVPPAVAAELHALAAAEGAGLDVALLAALMALVARYSGHDNVAVVTELPRTRASVASLVGPLGPRLLRADLGGDPDPRALIRLVKAVLDEATLHDDLPYVHVLPNLGLDEHGLAADGDRVKFVFEETTPGPRVRGPIAFERAALSAVATTADLELVVAGIAGNPRALLDVRLVLRTQRFDDAAADRIADHLERLVAALGRAEGPVSAIAIVGGEERAFLLAASCVSNVRYDEASPDVVTVIEAHAARTPHAVAVVFEDQSLTYAALHRAATMLAERLRSLGVGAGALVAVFLERGAPAVVAFLGILKAGGAYVPIDTSYPAGRVAAILAAAAPLVVITRAALTSALPPCVQGEAAPHFLAIDGPEMPVPVAPAAPAARAAPRSTRPSDAAYVIFTSGSTGQAKGVVVDHGSLSNYVRAAIDAYAFRAEDRVLQGASLGFDLSLEEIIVTLTSGAALVIRSAPSVPSVQAFVEECVQREISILSITSALWHELTTRLADQSVRLPPLLRLVILGADIARPDVLALWQRATGGRIRLVNSYGLTETTIVATVWEATSERLTDGWRAVPIGRPLRNVSAYVLDAKNALVPIGVPGELCIGGLAVASGYLGDEASTRARFVADPFLPGRRMYRTGDRGRVRPCGGLEFLGRLDYQMKIGGVRVELGEIEARLREIPGVVEAVVVARKNGAGEPELSAYVTASGPEVTAERLREVLGRALASVTVPTYIHVVDHLPLTPAGKIDRRALAGEARTETRSTEYVAPSTHLEELVAVTIADVLGLTRVGMLDALGKLGGTSLTAVRAASILGKHLGHQVRAQLLLEARSLRDVAAELGLRARREAQPASPCDLFARDAVLDAAIVSSSQPAGLLQTVLVTGATGFYGTFVLADLLRDTTAHVVCHVRAASPAAGLERIARSLAERQCAVAPALLAGRVSVVVGDLGLPQLGLDDAAWSRLGDTVDAIFHVGARVNMMLPYSALRPTNVLAVESVLRLATTGRPKTVHHVSTVDVLGELDPAHPDAMCERPVASSPGRLRDGYGQSKWVAERLVSAARERGIATYIHRPGRLMGHSETGAFNVDDMLVRMLDACGQVGAAPDLDVRLDITPVDYASRALVRLAQLEPPVRHPFHLVNSTTVSWSALVARVIELGYPVAIVPFDEWRSRLERHVAASDRPEFLLYLAGLSREEAEASVHGGYASEVTQATLGADLVCPPVDARLVEVYLARLAAAGRFPRAAAAARTPEAPAVAEVATHPPTESEGEALLRDGRLERRVTELEVALALARAEIERARSSAAEVSVVDAETGILSPRAFAERLSHEGARARRFNRPLALLQFTVEPRGTCVPDLLRRFTALCVSSVRATDIAGRASSGWEIHILLPETSPDGARILKERIATNAERAGLEVDYSSSVTWLYPRRAKVDDAPRRSAFSPPRLERS